jgi:hypothetical protein
LWRPAKVAMDDKDNARKTGNYMTVFSLSVIYIPVGPLFRVIVVTNSAKTCVNPLFLIASRLFKSV